MTFSPAQHDLLAALAVHLRAHEAPGWLVGGSVRDLVLGRYSADLDVAIAGDAGELARPCADGRACSTWCGCAPLRSRKTCGCATSRSMPWRSRSTTLRTRQRLT